MNRTNEPWNVTVSDATEYILGECDEPIDVESRRYKTTRGVTGFIDRFACDLRYYWVDSHVVTNNEILLECHGMRPTDTEIRRYSVYAYRNA